MERGHREAEGGVPQGEWAVSDEESLCPRSNREYSNHEGTCLNTAWLLFAWLVIVLLLPGTIPPPDCVCLLPVPGDLYFPGARRCAHTNSRVCHPLPPLPA